MRDLPMSHLVLLVQAFGTLAMVGVIWFVQLVHYPLFAAVDGANFVQYEQAHQARTTWVVAPLMLAEAVTAVALLWFRPAAVPALAVYLGLGLVAVLWLSTALWQVPLHERLGRGFEPAAHRWLVWSNWLRTIAWTARGLLVLWMIQRVLDAGANGTA